jgi:excisionase family DNA binding protein
VTAPKIGDVLRQLAAAVDAWEDASRSPAPPPADASALAWVRIRDCGLPERTCRRAIRAGEIRGAKVGRELLVSTEDIRRYVESKVRDVKPDNDLGDGDEVDRVLRLRRVGGGR